MSSEPVFLWEGKDWPPSSSSSDSFEVEGIIQKSFPLAARKAGVQTGYLRGATSSDVMVKFHGVTVQIQSVKSSKSGNAKAEFMSAVKSFATSVGKEKDLSLILAGGDSIVFWGKQTLPGDLKSRPDAPVNPLAEGSLVRITTKGADNIVQSLDVLKAGAGAQAAAKANVNVIDGALDRFKSAMNKESAASKDDDDWDD